jgi:cell division initiation protein
MKLSPLDIQHQEFAAALSGYSKRQVRDFLARAADSLEALIRENQQLREELAKRDKKIEELSVAEAELKRAVIAAERIGNEMKQNAKREAELIVQEAEMVKTKIIREAEARLKQTGVEVARLERQSQLFREQFRGLLKAYERSLDSLPEKTPASAEG